MHPPCLPPGPSLPPWTPDTNLPKFQAKQGSVKSTATQGEPIAGHAPCLYPKVRMARPQRCCSHSGKRTIEKHSLSCAHQTENDGGDPPSCLSVHPSPGHALCREVAGAKLWFLYNRRGWLTVTTALPPNILTVLQHFCQVPAP